MWHLPDIWVCNNRLLLAILRPASACSVGVCKIVDDARWCLHYHHHYHHDHLSIWSNISCMVFWTTRYWSIANCGFTDWGISTGSTLVVGKWKHWFTKYWWGLRWSWWWEYDYNDFEDRPCGKQGDCQPVLPIAQHHTIDLCREIIRPRTEIIFPTLEIIFDIFFTDREKFAQ